MPYRRLPNTDIARIRAIKTALEKEQDRTKPAFTFQLRQKLEFFIPRFEGVVYSSKMARSRQAENSSEVSEYTRKAKLYISHFIQVLNFCIIRGEMKPEVREFYGLKVNSAKVPPLVSDQDLMEWGEKIIKGEQDRIMSRTNGNAIYSPAIALVKVAFDKFKENHSHQKVLQNTSSRESGNVANLRDEADELILELWNTIESIMAGFFNNEEERRRECEKYGVVYIYRKGELEKIKKQQEIDAISPKLW